MDFQFFVTIIFFSITLAIVLVDYTLSVRNFGFIIFASALNGFLTVSVFSVAYELSADLTYPIDETNSCGIINSLASVWAIVFTLGLGAILSNS